MADPTWTPVAPGDRTWLLMDRPNNLMHVHSMIWLAEVPDWDAVQTVLAQRLVDRFPVFRRRAVTRDGVWVVGLPYKISVITVGQEYVQPGQIVDAKTDDTPIGASADGSNAQASSEQPS